MIQSPFRSMLPAVLAAAFTMSGTAAPNTPEGQTLEASKEAVVLARGGKALVPIVISPDASDAMKQSAAALSGFLQRITGAEFVVESGTTAKGITLGTLKQFPDETLSGPLAIRDTYDGLEAFAIRTDPGTVRLLANTDLGASHAMYRFLGLLGCRWFFPGSAWEVLPRQPELSFALNESSRPVIWSRHIGIGRHAESETGETAIRELMIPWARANAATDSLKIRINHQWNAIPETFGKGYFKKDFQEHPEYFALVNGKRTPPQFCVTNPGLQKLVVAFANKYLTDQPDADMVPFDTADQAGWCTCADCMKLGDKSNQAFFLANIVGRGIKETHPGKFVGILAYSWHSTPPDFAIEPNVYIALTAGFNVGQYTFDELLTLWSEKSRFLGIYEYFSVWLSNKGVFPGGKAANVDDFGRRMKLYVSRNVKGIVAEATADWGLHGLGHYVAAKVMWNPSADIGLLKKDFYDKAFGPASAVMEKYFERVNAANKPLPGKTLLLQCADDLDEAARLADGRPDVSARIEALKEFLVYNYLVHRIRMADPMGTGQPDQAPEENVPAELLADQKQKTIDLLEWSYRTRNNTMTQWTMTRSIVGRPASERYQDPSLFWRNTKDNPWRKSDLVTAGETARRLQEMRAELGSTPAVEEGKFSDRIVAVRTGLPEASAAKSSMFINSGPDLSTYYVMASLKGEPLRFRVSKKGNEYHERPEVRYTLTAMDGSEVLKGQFGNGEHDLELKVPGPGVYTFRSNGRDAWEIILPPGLPAALQVRRGERFMIADFDGPLSFYVPKGTKAIGMYPGDSGLVKISDPAGQAVIDQKADGGYVSIPVPEGMDGKVWSIGGRKLRLNTFWFFNVPTLFSTNPAAILVPEDVAKKDGLINAIP